MNGMHLTKKNVVISSLVALGLVALFFLAFPPLARYIAVQKISEATGRHTDIGRISFNPFTLSAQISGFRMAEKDGKSTFVSFSSARLSLSALSLPKRAFIVDELELASPYLHLVRSAPNQFNFTDLITGKKEPKPKESYLYSLNNITVQHGSLDFTDQALAREKQHQLREVALRVPFFSNIPYLADRYVTPHFSAQVNGTPVALNGRLRPLTKAMETTIDLKFQSLDIPFYLGYVPLPLPVRVDSGKLSSTLELGYRVDAKAGPEVTLSGSLTLDRLAVKQTDGAPLTQLQQGRVQIQKAALLGNQYDIGSVDLDQLEVHASRDAAGTWNFQRLNAARQAPDAAAQAKEREKNIEKEKQERKKPLQLKIGRFSLKAGTAHLTDAIPKPAFASDLKDIQVTVSNLSTAPGQRAPLEVRLATARGERVTLQGEVAPDPLELAVKLTLSGVPLKDYYSYLSDTLTTPITGTLGLTAQLLYSANQGLLIEKTNLKGDNLAGSFGKGEGFQLKETLLNGISLNLNQKKLLVEGVELRGGKVSLGKEADGSISAERLLRSKDKPATAKQPVKKQAKLTPKGNAPAPAPFSYRVNKVSGSDLGIRFTDRSKEDAPAFSLNRTKFTLAELAGPRQGPIPFTLSAGYGRKGQLSAAGNLTPTPLRLKGNLNLRGIPLRDFDAYIPEGTQIFLADGSLDTRLSYNLEKTGTELKGSFAGSLGVHSFYCLDTILDEDLLKWDSLQLDQVSGNIAPFSLTIKDVSLSNFYARVIVEKDGSLNLQHLTKETAGTAATNTPGGVAATKPAPAAKPVPAAPAAPAPATAAAPRPIKIDTVALQGGTLDFSDRHLKTPFDTTFYNLGGRVSGLNSETNRTADVDLRGQLENHSPLTITGVINPLRGDLYLDLKIAFTDIELSPFTPYSNTYLGYTVDKGKLNLDLTYKIDKKALSSQNKLFIDQFTFGKSVESDKATKLPVRLAVALLKDRKGEIHLNLPVVGQTDDPKFSVWGVVLQMLKNLMVKVATSPFALLGSMFGGGEDFSAVPFDPGSSRISKADEAKLLKLSELLKERPALNLEISGFVDRDKDAEGYRNELLTRKIKGEKFRFLAKEEKLKEGQTQEDTEVLPAEYSTYLKAVYAKEKFPKPRTMLGIAKDLPDAEMKKLILTHTVVGEHELQSLARDRAEAVRNFLLTKGQLPPQRLFEKNSDIFHPSAKEGIRGSRVEFGAMVK
jgi:uncharacterized protein involved in outer membrane biogenesis